MSSSGSNEIYESSEDNVSEDTEIAVQKAFEIYEAEKTILRLSRTFSNKVEHERIKLYLKESVQSSSKNNLKEIAYFKLCGIAPDGIKGALNEDHLSFNGNIENKITTTYFIYEMHTYIECDINISELISLCEYYTLEYIKLTYENPTVEMIAIAEKKYPTKHSIYYVDGEVESLHIKFT
jgi:hypothetical protein